MAVVHPRQEEEEEEGGGVRRVIGEHEGEGVGRARPQRALSD